MQRWYPVVLSALLVSLLAGAADAQSRVERFAVGIGLGLVDLPDSEFDDGSETYLSASLRILLGDKDGNQGRKKVNLYLEPEVGYWELDSGITLLGGDRTRGTHSDLLVGLNLIGVVPFQKTDYFFGGGLGIHSFDTGLDLAGVQFGNDEAFGINLQAGVDVHLGEFIDVYGLLRVDLVEKIQREQGKIVIGLRFNFG